MYTDNKINFLSKVYGHLIAAILIVVVMEIILFHTGIAQTLSAAMLSVPWILILGGFILLGWLARKVAYRTKTLAGQYAGLTIYILAETIILIPMLYLAESVAPDAIQYAAQFTITGFIGLTLIVFITKKDFSSLRPILYWVGFIALLLITAAILLGFNLGAWFDIIMIGLAGGSILSDTSDILRRYRKDRYVAAALELFAASALMFWYILRMLRRSP